MALFPNVQIGASFFIIVALWVLALPLNWVGAWFAAAGFHELGHFIALKILRVKVGGIYIGATGAKIHTGCLRCWEELICSLAGPLSGLLLLGCAAVMPRVAFCALIQSLVNLIPVYPADGGRALRCLRKGMKILLAKRRKKG